MAASRPLRPIGAALGVVAGGGASLLLDAPAAAALLTAAVAGIAMWAALRPLPFSPEPVIEEDEEPTGVDEIVAALPDPLLVIARQAVVRANPAALSLFGSHIVGQDVRLAIRHPAARGLLEVGATGRTDLTGLGEAGRRWELTLVAIATDVRLALLRDRSEADTAERVRVDFVANASHELRTPLATLLGFIETLEEANGPKDAAVRTRFLKVMMGEAERMQRLIDDLISLSRIEADRYSPPSDLVDFAELLQEAADVIRTGLGDRVERLQVTAPADGLMLTGDRVQLGQLVHNVVGNALKYGRPDLPVSVEALAVDGQLRLRVADRGDGIAAVHLPRLTERFYRADPGRSRAIGGTGLGLAIVKHIVERHRGRLEIASVEGEGTTVTVMLPMALS